MWGDGEWRREVGEFERGGMAGWGERGGGQPSIGGGGLGAGVGARGLL